MAQSLSILADVGGTNARLVLAENKTILPDTIRTFKNDDFPDFGSVLEEFNQSKASSICVDWAGPIENGKARLTNRDWTVDAQVLKRQRHLSKCIIINDLQAQGYALDQLDHAATHRVIDGPTDPRKTRLVVNIGTGFNASPVHKVNGNSFVPVNEAGHVELPTRSEGQRKDLQPCSTSQDDFMSVEDCLSGAGLQKLVATYAPDFVQPSAQIFPTFANSPQGSLRKPLGIFAKAMGSVAGDLALNHLPVGGIYLVGGVAAGIAPHLDKLGFEASFKTKGRFTDFMERFSVTANLDPLAALKGCAVALQLLD